MAELILVPASQRLRPVDCGHEYPCSCVELDGVVYKDIPAAMDALEYRVASHWPGRHAMLERESILVKALESVISGGWNKTGITLVALTALEAWKKCRTSQA